MVAFLIKVLLVVRSRLHSQARLQAEILVLRQQMLILDRKSPSRVRLRNLDRAILVWLYRLFPALLKAITVSLHKNAPLFRRRQTVGKIVSMPILGGLHHQYLRL
jgi:hypothetical protein